MNNVFDFKRFGNYFLYDLRCARNNYGLSLLILGGMPLIVFVFAVLTSLVFTHQVDEMNSMLKILSMWIPIVIVLLGAGTKLYGRLTEKRAGSDFLMLPASTLEKWLSMVLVVCIVLPIILFALFFICDTLLGLLLPNIYGERVFASAAFTSLMGSNPFSWMGEGDPLFINFPAMTFLNWCVNILVFTLGAVCFKKSKVAKTLLCLFGLSVIFSFAAMILFGTANLDLDWFEEHFNDPDRLESSINWTISLVFTFVIGGLLAGLWYRLRTLKH